MSSPFKHAAAFIFPFVCGDRGVCAGADQVCRRDAANTRRGLIVKGRTSVKDDHLPTLRAVLFGDRWVSMRELSVCYDRESTSWPTIVSPSFFGEVKRGPPTISQS